jgi:hypothetical protein
MTSRVRLPTLFMFKLRLSYASALIEIAAGIGVLKKALCRHARRVLTETNARLEAEQRRREEA